MLDITKKKPTQYFTDAQWKRVVDTYRTQGLNAACHAIKGMPPDKIYKRLVYFNVHVPPPRCESAAGGWSTYEDQVVRDHYAFMGPTKLQNILEGRSVLAIKKRASVLGVSAQEVHANRGHAIGAAWTDEETRLLSVFLAREPKGLPRNWPSLEAAIPTRTRSAIEGKIASLAKPAKAIIKRAAPRPWTSSEDTKLRQIYGTMPADQVALQIGRSKAAVTNRAYDLNLTSKQDRR